MKNEIVNVGIFRTKNASKFDMPKFETFGSAAVDVRASLSNGDKVTVIDKWGDQHKRSVYESQLSFNGNNDKIIKIPTGMFFDIPENFALITNSRSGLALKEGVGLANGSGVIDSDYTGELFIPLRLSLKKDFIINNGDRIAQMRIVNVNRIVFDHLQHCPHKASRGVGGFGSTGVV